jgi:hypothetical protein
MELDGITAVRATTERTNAPISNTFLIIHLHFTLTQLLLGVDLHPPLKTGSYSCGEKTTKYTEGRTHRTTLNSVSTGYS